MFLCNLILFDLYSIFSEVSIIVLPNVFVILIGLRLANSLILIFSRKDTTRYPALIYNNEYNPYETLLVTQDNTYSLYMIS
jgi:hypothetical protein